MAEIADLSTAVMTHPLRLRLAHEVAESLAELNPALAIDPDPHAKPRTLRTSIRAWDSARPNASYHLVIQDDALPVANFTEHVADILATQPTCPVALFAVCYSRNGWAVRWGSTLGARFVAGVPEYVPCVALLMPAAEARNYVRFAEAWHDPDTADDYVMRAFFDLAGLDLMVTVPSLVEHRPVRSLVGNDFLNGAACVGNPQPGWFREQVPALGDYPALILLDRGELSVCRIDDEATPRGVTVVPFESEARHIEVDIDDLMDTYNRFLLGIPAAVVDRWFAAAHPQLLWTAWLAAYVLRNQRLPAGCRPDKSDPALRDWSLRTILTELPMPAASVYAASEYLDLLYPLVAGGYSTVGAPIVLGSRRADDGS